MEAVERCQEVNANGFLERDLPMTPSSVQVSLATQTFPPSRSIFLTSPAYPAGPRPHRTRWKCFDRMLVRNSVLNFGRR